MDSLLSITRWLCFLQKMLNAFLPIIPILVFFSWRSRKSFLQKENSKQWLIIGILATLDIFIRILLFFADLPYQGRYFHVLLIFFCIFAAPGLPHAANWLADFASRFKKISSDAAFKGLVVAIALIHTGKALSPPDHKKWLDEVPSLIREKCPSGAKPVLISEYPDIRIAYYAGADDLRLERRDNNYLENAEIFVNDKKAPELNDGDKKTCIVLDSTSEIRFFLPSKMPYSRASLILYGSDLSEIELSVFQDDDSKTPFSKPEQSGKNRFVIKFRHKPLFSELRTRIKVPENSKCSIDEIKLVLADKWDILRFGKGISQGRKFSAVPPKNILGFKDSLSEIVGQNVFLLTRMPDEIFRHLFEEENAEFPLELVAEIEDNNKGVFTLYRKKPR